MNTEDLLAKAHPFDVEVGRRIRALRLARGLSQERVASALDVAFQQLQKYEKGTNRCPPSRLFQIAKVLGCRPADFFPTPDDPDSGALAAAFGEMSSRLAIRAVRALNRIPDSRLRNAFVDMVESCAAGCAAMAASADGGGADPAPAANGATALRSPRPERQMPPSAGRRMTEAG